MDFFLFCHVAFNYWGIISKEFWKVSSVPKTIGQRLSHSRMVLPIYFLSLKSLSISLLNLPSVLQVFLVFLSSKVSLIKFPCPDRLSYNWESLHSSWEHNLHGSDFQICGFCSNLGFDNRFSTSSESS